MKVGRLWEDIRRRFGFGSKLVVDDEPQQKPDRRRLPRVRRTGFLNMDAFAGELVQIKEGSTDPLPHLHVFSLSDFRNAVGKKWDKLGGLVEVAVESIIRRHVNTDKDIFTRLDAEIACLALPHTTRAETRTRVTAIARDIAAHLFGDAVIDGRRPQVLAANLPLEEALTEEGDMDWEAIHGALAKAGAALAASAPSVPKGQAAPHRSTLAELMTPEDAALAKAEAERLAKARKGGFSISGGDERRQVSAPAWFMEQMEGQGTQGGDGGARKGADTPMRVMNLSSETGGADAPRRVMVVPPNAMGGADAARTVVDMSGNALSGADAARTVMQVSGASLSGADAARTVMDVSSRKGGGGEHRVQAGAEGASAGTVPNSWYQDDGKGQLAGADAERRVMVVEGGPKGPGEMDVMQVEGTGNWGGGPGLSPETSLTLVWTPTWVTSRRAIGAFHARIIRTDKDGAATLEGVHAYDNVTPVEALTLDRFAASQAARELTSLFYARQKLGLTIPIHWMSLSPKHRDMVRIPFEACPADARRKFLKVEVFGLNSSVPTQVLRRMFEPLERVGCDVMARLPLSAVDMIPALAHLRAVGVDLAELPEDDRVGDDELFRRLEEFREAAKKVKVASYVWGVRRRPLIARLVASGFSLVNGPGVMCDLSHPTLPSKGGQAV